MRVYVYFNLHKKVWSVKALDGPNKGKVIRHSSEVSLIDAQFRVSEAGRQRVLREQRKNVHAGVVGYLAPFSEIPNNSKQLRYNPYKGPKFIDENGMVYEKANRVVLTPEKRVLAW